MKLQQLSQLSAPLWSSAMAAQALGVRNASARLACHRYVKGGHVVRLKRDLYVTKEAWDRFRAEDFFAAANRLQVPSYVSFTTALSYWQVTSQVPQGFVESASTIRSWRRTVDSVHFRYIKLPAAIYRGFTKKDGFFMAVPEKAFLDALYLMALGRYRLDFSAMDTEKLDMKELKKYWTVFPKKIQKRMSALWKR